MSRPPREEQTIEAEDLTEVMCVPVEWRAGLRPHLSRLRVTPRMTDTFPIEYGAHVRSTK